MAIDAWAEVMRKRLARARLNPPDVDVLRPVVNPIARNVSQQAAAARLNARVSVARSGDKLVVSASGRDARQVQRALQANLKAGRREMAYLAQMAARDKLRGWS